MSITVTENAAKQIAKQIQQRGTGLGLKVGAKVSGCSGYAYELGYADEQSENETVFEQFGVKIIVENEDMDKLDGLVLDYVKEGINASFKFNNPNATGVCGCGESFSV